LLLYFSPSKASMRAMSDESSENRSTVIGIVAGLVIAIGLVLLTVDYGHSTGRPANPVVLTDLGR
jgi:hypothetical protein